MAGGDEWKLAPERLVQAAGYLGDGCYTGTQIEQFSCVWTHWRIKSPSEQQRDFEFLWSALQQVSLYLSKTDKLVPTVVFSTGFEFVTVEIPSTKMNNYPLPQQPQRAVLCFWTQGPMGCAVQYLLQIPWNMPVITGGGCDLPLSPTLDAHFLLAAW